MAQACFDIVVPDTTARSVKLNATQSPIKLPLGLNGSYGDVRSVLTYDFQATDNPQGLKYSVDIVDGSGAMYHVSTRTISSDVQRVFQDVVPTNALSGDNPQVRIKVESGTGELHIYNMVLWYWN